MSELEVPAAASVAQQDVAAGFVEMQFNRCSRNARDGLL